MIFNFCPNALKKHLLSKPVLKYIDQSSSLELSRDLPEASIAEHSPSLIKVFLRGIIKSLIEFHVIFDDFAHFSINRDRRDLEAIDYCTCDKTSGDSRDCATNERT